MYYEKMDEINLKMELMGLSDEARQRVKSYYMYIWKRLKSFSGDKNFLDDLPFKLRCSYHHLYCFPVSSAGHRLYCFPVSSAGHRKTI
eukprot:SAG31_NODE_1251_length_9110_cov_5.844412_6_plen_88_part_00